MDVIAGCREGVEALAALLGVVDAEQLPGRLAGLSDDEVVAVVAGASAVIGALDAVRIAAVGVVAQRSARDRGHGGLAQKRGHRSSVSLVQELTGATRSEAAARVRIGEAVLEGVSEDGPLAGVAAGAEPGDAVSSRPWHAVLGDALLSGSLTAVQHDAIRRGLGEPPDPSDEDAREACDAAWRVAAAQLIDEAAVRTVEELRIAARTVRDILDPEGAQRRFDERFQARSFRMWMDENGIHRASVSFDDDAALWVRSVIDAALRPRRGGPRFVDPDEAAAA